MFIITNSPSIETNLIIHNVLNLVKLALIQINAGANSHLTNQNSPLNNLYIILNMVTRLVISWSSKEIILVLKDDTSHMHLIIWYIETLPGCLVSNTRMSKC